jgi:hypothetical protein
MRIISGVSEDHCVSFLHIAAGGIVAGLIIILGEAILNVRLLADQWTKLRAQQALSAPSRAAAAQVPLKLMLLAIFSVWLAVEFKPAEASLLYAGIVSGLIIWLLIWAWVPWGLLLSGYMSPAIAATTVAWGLIELPLAVCAGVWVYGNLANGTA